MTQRINREADHICFVKMLIGTIFLFAMLVLPNMTVCAEGDTVTLSGSGKLTRQYVEENLGDATEVIITGFSEIESYAFEGCSSLTKVTITDSVTKVWWGVFEGCDNLKTAGPIGGGYNIEFGWKGSIPRQAFYECGSLTSVTIPDNVTTIGEYAFYECSSLTSVTIPKSVTTIETAAFEGCSGLTSVTIPNSVTTIQVMAFSGCSSLTSVTIPNSATTLGVDIFSDCDSLKTAGPIGGGYNIEFGWKGSIPSPAFSGCSSLTSVTIPNSVTTIEVMAFSGCSSLTSVTIPSSVTTIDWSAFEKCSSLTSVTIPNSVTTIGAFAFSGCSSLSSVAIPNSVTMIGDSTFSGCSSLTSVTLPKSVTYIGESAFQNCSSLSNITQMDGVKEIGRKAFSGCTNLQNIVFSRLIREMEENIFAGCINVSISGYTGTKAEEYANDNEIPFVSLGKCENIVFDVTELSGYIPYEEEEKCYQYVVGEPYGVFPQVELWSDYAFDGWYLDKECTRRVTIYDTFQSGNNTLYAKSVSSEEIKNGFANIYNQYYWYEGGVRQGTYDDPKGVVGDGTVRGREIYDPDSDGWYWLDACYDGAKACNKEVWMPYIYQDEDNWGEEELQRNADASGLMSEQVKKAIQDKDGKWVRYDENGKMYKGWYDADASLYPKQAGNRYYYDQKTGLMAKGWLNIDGVDYHFDEITGALIR